MFADFAKYPGEFRLLISNWYKIKTLLTNWYKYLFTLYTLAITVPLLDTLL